MPQVSSCTIVVPCYNESSRLQSNRFLDFVRKFGGVSLLFVNDGSTDNTPRILEALSRASDGRIKVIDSRRNGGKAEAVRLGMLTAIDRGGSNFIGFWDADLAVPLDEIPEFISLMTGNERLDMVFGSRVRLLGRQIERRPVRHYLGRVFASCASLMLRLPIYDTQCGAKIFRLTPEFHDVMKDPFLSRWVFDVEILARYIKLQGGRTYSLSQSMFEFPLKRWNDISGSKVRPSDFFKAFVDIVRIYRVYLAHGARSKAALTDIAIMDH
jgi:dolichyl-phosphate beta-glucosyltransferase